MKPRHRPGLCRFPATEDVRASVDPKPGGITAGPHLPIDWPLVHPVRAASFEVMSGPPWKLWYKAARWRALRLHVFARDRFTCGKCSQRERNTSLLVCDHIEPHRGRERLFWDDTNLQTLCTTCHNKLKQKEEQQSLHTRGVWY